MLGLSSYSGAGASKCRHLYQKLKKVKIVPFKV